MLAAPLNDDVDENIARVLAELDERGDGDQA
jgi:hypothetical protein